MRRDPSYYRGHILLSREGTERGSPIILGRTPAERLKTHRGPVEPTIALAPARTRCDSAVRTIIDDWLVPVLVEEFLAANGLRNGPAVIKNSLCFAPKQE